MKFAFALCLLISPAFLTACSFLDRPTPVIPKECTWAEAIEFDQATKDWLTKQEWPPSAASDFNKIGDHNELFAKLC